MKQEKVYAIRRSRWFFKNDNWSGTDYWTSDFDLTLDEAVSLFKRLTTREALLRGESVPVSPKNHDKLSFELVEGRADEEGNVLDDTTVYWNIFDLYKAYVDCGYNGEYPECFIPE